MFTLPAAVATLGILLFSGAMVALSHPAGASPAETAAPGAAFRSSPAPLFSQAPSSAAGVPLGSGPGSVVSTLDLVSDQLLAGATQPVPQNDPNQVIYDPFNDDLYVRGGLGDSITVVDATTDRVVTEITVPATQNSYSLAVTMAVDPETNEILATSTLGANVTIVDGTSNEIVGAFPAGGEPNGVLYDPASHSIYVSDWSSHNVTVVNASTYQPIGSVPTYANPGPMLFDPVDREVFVLDEEQTDLFGNVSVVNASANRVMYNVSTARFPAAMVLDPVNEELAIADSNDGGVGRVTLINLSTPRNITNLTTGYDTDGIAFAPAEDQVFAANGGSGTVAVIDPKNDTFVTNLTTGRAPGTIAYDPVNGGIYVLNAESSNLSAIDPANDSVSANVSLDDGLAYGMTIAGASGNLVAVSEGTYDGSSVGGEANLTVVSPATNRSIASVPLNAFPNGITWDPVLGSMLVADPGGNAVYEINGSTDLLGGRAIAGLDSKWSAFDPLSDTLWVLGTGDDSVTVLNASLQPVTTIPVGYDPTAIAYDTADADMYITSAYGGNVTVINGPTYFKLAPIVIHAYDDLTDVLYDPHSQEVYVTDQSGNNVTVIDGGGIVTSFGVASYPISMAFDSENDTIFVANEHSLNVSVINDSRNAVATSFGVTEPGLLLYDPANNLLYNELNVGDDLATVNASSYQPVGGLIYLGEGAAATPTGMAYDPVNHEIYVSDQYSNTVSIISTAPSYPVYVNETGLAPETEWFAQLNTTSLHSTTPSIAFTEPNGTYGLAIGSIAGYVANVTSEEIHVSGGPTVIEVGFSSTAPPVFPVTFEEIGLPQGELWNVTLNGTLNGSSTASIGFSEIGGSYPFTVGPVTGYSATPSSGTVVVSGSTSQTITFTNTTSGAFSVSLSVSPSSVAVGSTASIIATPTDGIAPIDYAYIGLPPGCGSVDAASFSCTPSGVGTGSGIFHISVSATDGRDQIAIAMTELKVTNRTGTSSPSPSSSPGIPVWAWGAAGAGVAVLLIVLLLWRRRRKDRLSPAPSATTEVESGSPGPEPPSG